jgi:hypothetical protein
VQIELGGLHHAVGGEQPAHQLLQAIRLGDDHLGVFAQLRVVQLPLEQLGRAADAAEGVLDLVGQVAHELPVGLLLMGQLLLPRHLQLGVHRAKLEQQARIDDLHRRHGAIEVQGFHAGRSTFRLCPV